MLQQQQTVVIQQPVQAQGLLRCSPNGDRDWTSGLFDCGNDICGVLKLCCCTDIQMCSLYSRAGENSCTDCIVPGALINLRTKTRTMGGITGSMTDDCCVTNTCGPCALCQLDRELTAMGL